MQNSEVFILAIESSCDDTAAAVLHNDKVLSNVVANQLIHNQYGGVVPEVAARAHLEAIQPTLDKALKEAGIDIAEVDAIAVANGPGLAGALMVGIGAAKGLALAHDKPLYAVNHLVGHVGADVLERGSVELPTIALLVSGGHTSLLLVRDLLSDVVLLGETIDDAAGEAFDKTAKLIGLPYPGGPLIDKLAKEGNPDKYPFPMGEMPGLDFSFSGIKTAILYFLQKEVKLNPQVQVADESMVTKAMELHHRAHEICYIANSVNFEVRCEPNVNVLK